MKKHLWAVLYTAGLLAFTAFITLDTFVITKKYNTNAGQINTDIFNSLPNSSSSASSEDERISSVSPDSSVGSDSSDTESDISSDTSSETSSSESFESEPSTPSEPVSETPPEPDPEPEYTFTVMEKNENESDYQDENISITMMKYRICDTTVYAADVRLSSAQYLKTAFANDTYGRNIKEKTSEIAAAHNAILAINGDYYGARERGCVIRNGVAYRDNKGNTDVLCVYANGSMRVVAPYSISSEALVEQGVWQAFSFGPRLVDDGAITVSPNDEVSIAKANNQRTAIGIFDDLHYLMIVTDGRTTESKGLSLYELASLMKALGVKMAYNLDGGGSSTMVYRGVLLNNPTASGDIIAERRVSDIVYLG